jgi:hypothetical protein
MVILDEIDSTLKLPYTDDLFVALRAMYNDRPQETAFEQVAFCLVGVTTPNELIKDQRTTPYNVGRMIELRDFDPAHATISARSIERSRTNLKRGRHWCAESCSGPVGISGRVDDLTTTLSLYRHIWRSQQVLDRTTPVHIWN